MLFTEPSFLFLFLPLTVAAYYLLPRGGRNGLLLAASLTFYAWGEWQYVGVMLGSIAVNHLLAIAIERTRRGVLLALGVVLNLAVLAYFKYALFLLSFMGITLSDALLPAHLPLGISFFTFQALSYLIDVYRRTVPACRSISDSALYISLFPQLIAGPIVRYHDIAAQIQQRRESSRLFLRGLRRFALGLARKLLLANPLGELADVAFNSPVEQLDVSLAWLGVLAFSLQIYFDFSAYSDMAIGLARMFGFELQENFRYPYSAGNVRDFWRRWHISLSRWFRDYLYIPLGGNRCGYWRTGCHLLLVFFLCGLWHGASWNFVIWGLLHGAVLMLERGAFGRFINGLWPLLQRLYLLLFVGLAWVFFRLETLPQALSYMKALCGLGGKGQGVAMALLGTENLVVLGLAILLSGPLYPRILAWLQPRLGKWREPLQALQLWGLLVLVLLSIASSSYQPFIYFRF